MKVVNRVVKVSPGGLCAKGANSTKARRMFRAQRLSLDLTSDLIFLSLDLNLIFLSLELDLIFPSLDLDLIFPSSGLNQIFQSLDLDID